MAQQPHLHLHPNGSAASPPPPRRPGTSHSNHLPEPAPIDSGLHVAEHERVLPARHTTRAGTGAIAYKGPGRALFDRFYDRRRGHATVITGETDGLAPGAAEEKIQPDVTYPGRSGTYGFEQRERRRRRRKWGVGVGTLLVIAVALAVGLGVGLTRKKSPTPAPAPPPNQNDPSPHCPQNNGTTLHSNNQSFLQLCATDFKAGVPATSNNPPTKRQTSASPNSVQDLPAGAEGDANHTSGLVRTTFQRCIDACAEWNVQKGYALGGHKRRGGGLARRQNDDEDENEPDEDESPDPATSTASASSTASVSSSARSRSSSSSTSTSPSTSASTSSASSSATSATSSPSASAPIASAQCHGVTYIGNLTWVNASVSTGGGQNRNCYLKSGVPAGGGEVGTLGMDSASALLIG